MWFALQFIKELVRANERFDSILLATDRRKVGTFMKALVKYASGNGNLMVMDVDEPQCGSKQVKVEIAYCGVCGTDLHVMHDTFRNYPPVILGHEFSGTVVEVGNEVETVSVGDRITGLGATAVTCGECEYCRQGYFIFCSRRRGMGHGVNGAFTRYVLLRPDQVYKIPPDFSLEEAAMSEPFAAAVQAVTEITTVRLGDTALVSGPGPIGLLCLKLLVANGIKTIVAGAPKDDERLAYAMQYGAHAVINVGNEDLQTAVKEYTGGRGVDVAFECAGVASSVRGCINALRPMGQHTQVAICGRDIEFPIDQIFYKQLKMAGSITYTANTWRRMMEIYATGKIQFDDMISAKLPISDWERAFELCMTKQAVKVLMYPI
jgi:L-iditol 2-dehydrogenase